MPKYCWFLLAEELYRIQCLVCSTFSEWSTKPLLRQVLINCPTQIDGQVNNSLAYTTTMDLGSLRCPEFIWGSWTPATSLVLVPNTYLLMCTEKISSQKVPFPNGSQKQTCWSICQSTPFNFHLQNHILSHALIKPRNNLWQSFFQRTLCCTSCKGGHVQCSSSQGQWLTLY
jgi:hypothetical protein